MGASPPYLTEGSKLVRKYYTQMICTCTEVPLPSVGETRLSVVKPTHAAHAATVLINCCMYDRMWE